MIIDILKSICSFFVKLFTGVFKERRENKNKIKYSFVYNLVQWHEKIIKSIMSMSADINSNVMDLENENGENYCRLIKTLIKNPSLKVVRNTVYEYLDEVKTLGDKAGRVSIKEKEKLENLYNKIIQHKKIIKFKS